MSSRHRGMGHRGVVAGHRPRRAPRRADRAADRFPGGDPGIDGASVKEVAQAAEVTPGLLYHYFASKEAMVTALFAERGFVPELRRLLEQQGGRPAAEVLPELLARFEAVLVDNASLVRPFFAAADFNESARAALHEFCGFGMRAARRLPPGARRHRRAATPRPPAPRCSRRSPSVGAPAPRSTSANWWISLCPVCFLATDQAGHRGTDQRRLGCVWREHNAASSAVDPPE